ncbi:MAG TPA: hypothetical protein VHN79_05790 [Lacunisphaera sp.]|nr:hypothetical protein [Lacunisphaera sp.]
MKPAEDVSENLQRLRAAGFAAAEVGAHRPKLEAVWTVPDERNFGWLNAEAVEKIKAVDLEFIPRMRSARLFAMVGIQLDVPPVTVTAVNREWRRAILRALDFDELAEFRLANSAAARGISRLLEGISITSGEERRLFQLERDFRAAYGSDPVPGQRPRNPYEREARLDHLAAIRETLGDERFAVYLGRADSIFSETRQVLGRLGIDETGSALALWQIRQGLELKRSRQGVVGGRTGKELDADAQAAVAAVLGEAAFQRYAGEDGARWLFSTRRSTRTAAAAERRQ